MRRTGSAEVVIDVSPEAAWDVVSDVTRVGEWSGECQECVLEDPERGLQVGARFRGRNRRSGLRWTRVNECTALDPMRELSWRTLAGGVYPDSVAWTIRLAPEEDGVRVTESFHVVRLPRWMEVVIGIAVPAHKDRTVDLSADLGRLKALVEESEHGARHAG